MSAARLEIEERTEAGRNASASVAGTNAPPEVTTGCSGVFNGSVARLGKRQGSRGGGWRGVVLFGRREPVERGRQLTSLGAGPYFARLTGAIFVALIVFPVSSPVRVTSSPACVAMVFES